MISKEPESLEKFPVPVSGQPIPRGWFARLVTFINSLVLRGDNQYFAVSHSNAGTTIKPTKKLVDLLDARGGAPASGSVQDLSVSVTGGTATIALSGSTDTVPVVAGSNVNITGNTNGEVVVSATGGTGTNLFFPDYATSPVSITDGTVYPVSADSWLIGTAGLYKTSSTGFPAYVTLKIYSSDGTTIVRTFDLISDTGIFGSSYNSNQPFDIPVCRPIKAGYQIEVIKSGAASFNLSLFSV
jgi:hypothetical protein